MNSSAWPVDRVGQGQLADEDLAGLAQHALLAGGQAAVLVAAPQVTDDLGDLVNVTGGETLLVGLVAAGPVAGLLHIRLAQDAEDLLQALLADDVTDADKLGVLGRDADDEVGLVDLLDQVLQLLPSHHAMLDVGDLGGTVVRVDDDVPDLEIHSHSLLRAVGSTLDAH